MPSLVSIIIPNYNRATLIGDTLNSILNQTYTNWECLVIDDGSKDDSETVVRTFSKKDARIQFFKRPSHKPKGANACRNFGFEISKGKYINWFDSDDVMHKDKLLKQIEALETGYYPFSVCQSLVFEHSIDNPIGLKSGSITSANPFLDFIAKRIIIPIQAPIFKKEFLLVHDYTFDESLQAAQEWYFFARILFSHPNYHVIHEPLDYIRSHPDNISNAASNKKYWHYFLARYKLFHDLKDQLTQESIDELNIFFLFLFKFFVRSGHFKNAWYVWVRCLVHVKALGFKEHLILIKGFLSYLLINKGDGILSKVSLYK
jgi:glycosyltransferase involved in cell wall biosynthesis